MTYTMEDFNRDYIKKYFARLTAEEQREALERLSPEDRREVLQALPPEDRLAGLSPEDRREVLQALPPAERMAGLSLEDRLAGLSEEQVRQLVEQLATRRPGQPRKPRGKR